MLVPTNESKKVMEKYEELWSKTRNLISSITKSSDNNDKKTYENQFNSDDDLPLHKTKEIRSIIIVIRAVFHGDNKYYPQVFLDKSL